MDILTYYMHKTMNTVWLNLKNYLFHDQWTEVVQLELKLPI